MSRMLAVFVCLCVFAILIVTPTITTNNSNNNRKSRRKSPQSVRARAHIERLIIFFLASIICQVIQLIRNNDIVNKNLFSVSFVVGLVVHALGSFLV